MSNPLDKHGKDIDVLAIALSLLRQPATFRIIKGIVEKKPMMDISREYKIHYNYVQSVVKKLAGENLVVKVKKIGRLVVIPTPTLESAFKLALRELYIRAKTQGANPEEYGFTMEKLESLVKPKDRGDGSR